MSRSLAILSLTVAVISCAVATEDAEARCRRYRHGHHRDHCCANYGHGHSSHHSGYSSSGYGNSGCCGDGQNNLSGCQITSGAHGNAAGQNGFSGSNTSYYRGNSFESNPGNLNHDLNHDPNQIQNRHIRSGVDSAADVRNEINVDAKSATTEGVPPAPEQ